MKKIGFAIWNYIKTLYKLIMENLKQSNASRWLIALVIVFFVLMFFRGINGIIGDGSESSGQVYKAIGFGMVMLWVCIFVCYFIWAIFFYNINKGRNYEKRKRIEEAKLNRSKGLPYRKEDIDESQENPYKDETFGFPQGTVRGMIAFTLLYGAIAMLIVSFGVQNDPQSNVVFIDQLDFFKKAFLMMIAFYFGSHSLKYLTPDNAKKNSIENQQTQTDKSQAPVEVPKETEIVVIPSENNVAKPITVDDKEIPPIQAIDPMSPKSNSNEKIK
jgi:preprotein translocase subunit SecG